jgi:hypothetical protein
MAESLVPPPSFIIMMHCETEWPCHLQLQPVHAILGPLHPSKETSLPIPNLQHAAFDQHVRAALVHLPNVDDRVPQAWDPVHCRQDLVLAALSGEDDGALATDVDDGAAPELDGTLHCSVMLGEHFAAAYHVVSHAHVKVPALKIVVGAGSCVEERLCLGLIQVDQLLLLQH